jgi:phenylpropionate dioxygenase-like ring-hydroxylating dioxygenase large terminal subunit
MIHKPSSNPSAPRVSTVHFRPKPSVQEVLAHDKVAAPECLRFESPAQNQSDADVSIDRYFSKDWHDKEVDKVWRKTWQMACRVEEIQNVGDHIVYEIVHDSLIIVRQSETVIRAYVNSCLHRGTQLCTNHAATENVRHFKCPVHGFTWSLEGALVGIPSAWDFPHIDRAKFNLPEAKVGVWGGFVFINMDANSESLENYLEVLPEHFQAFNLENRYKAVHGAKIMPCNWKLAQEAFMEGFHIATTHPQSVAYTGDTNTQYDVFNDADGNKGRHVSRFIMLEGVPSPALNKAVGAELEESIVAAMQRDMPFYGSRPMPLDEGESARHRLADHVRSRLGKSSGQDMSKLSDSESLDLIQYLLFPNLSPWGGQATPLVYRFRPHGDNPEESIMEIMLLFAKNADGSHPPACKVTHIGIEDSWHLIPGIGSAADVTDQDTDNLKRIQRGIRAAKKPGVTLSNYQESRIRHFHETLDHYMNAP